MSDTLSFFFSSICLASETLYSFRYLTKVFPECFLKNLPFPKTACKICRLESDIFPTCRYHAVVVRSAVRIRMEISYDMIQDESVFE